MATRSWEQAFTITFFFLLDMSNTGNISVNNFIQSIHALVLTTYWSKYVTSRSHMGNSHKIKNIPQPAAKCISEYSWTLVTKRFNYVVGSLYTSFITSDCICVKSKNPTSATQNYTFIQIFATQKTNSVCLSKALLDIIHLKSSVHRNYLHNQSEWQVWSA